MNWNHYRQQLEQGQTVQFRPRGNSMTGRIESGQLVTVDPTQPIGVGDIVFCRVKGNYYVHLVKAIRDGQYQIGNNHGRINGWTKQVWGRVIQIQD